MDSTLPDLPAELLPSELLLDPTHPTNDEYTKNSKRLLQHITALRKRMPLRTVEICRLAQSGIPNSEIARRLHLKPQTVSNHKNRPIAKQFQAAVAYYHAHLAGPHLALRVNMLWRIAKDHEETSPRIAISAIAEINKVEIALKAVSTTQNQASQENTNNRTLIVLDQKALPRTSLDNSPADDNT